MNGMEMAADILERTFRPTAAMSLKIGTPSWIPGRILTLPPGIHIPSKQALGRQRPSQLTEERTTAGVPARSSYAGEFGPASDEDVRGPH